MRSLINRDNAGLVYYRISTPLSITSEPHSLRLRLDIHSALVALVLVCIVTVGLWVIKLEILHERNNNLERGS